MSPDGAAICATQFEEKGCPASGRFGIEQKFSRVQVFWKYIEERVFAEQIRNSGCQHLCHVLICIDGSAFGVDDP